MTDLKNMGEPASKTDRNNRGNVRQCETCGKLFASNRLLERHKRSHTKETPYACKTCNAKFSQSNSLRIHEKLHLGIKKFICSLCPMAFMQKANLMTHVKKVHPTDETVRSSKLACQYCESFFSNKVHLSHHQISLHAGKQNDNLDNTINNVMADLISMSQQTSDGNKSNRPKVNNSIENLKITKSEGVRLYHCNVCDYGFKKPSDLLRHSVVHTNERPHQCPMCKNRYRLLTVLRDHMKNHHCIKFKSNKNTVLQECIYAAQDQGNASEQTNTLTEEPSQYQSNLSNVTIEVNPSTFNYGLSMPLLSDTESINSPFLIGDPSNVGLTTRQSEESETCQIPEDQHQTPTELSDSIQNNPSVKLKCDGTSLLQDNKNTPQDADNVAELFKDLLEESNQFNISDEIIDITPASINKILLMPSVSDDENLNSAFLVEAIASQEAEQSQLLTLQSDKGEVAINVIDEFLTRKKPTTNIVVEDEPILIELSYIQDNVQNEVSDMVIDDLTEVVLCDDKQINIADIDLPMEEDNIFTSSHVKIINAPNKYIDENKKITVLVNQLLKEGSSNCDLDNVVNHIASVETEQNSLICEPSEITKQLLVDSYFNVKPPSMPTSSLTENLTGESNCNATIDNDVFTTNNIISEKSELQYTEAINIAELTDMEQCNQQANKLISIENEMPADPVQLIDTLLKPTSNVRQSMNSGKTCAECSATFKRRYDLVQHMRTHTREQPYPCSTCGRPFTTKRSMRLHQYIHMSAEERPKFHCHVCGKCLSSKTCLNVHMRLHNNSKPYQCPVCELRFRNASNRKLHIVNYHIFKKGRKKSLKDMILDLDLMAVDNIGSQNKMNSTTHISKRKLQPKYRCVTCKKIFTQRSVIRRHVLTHTDVKAHKCATCGETYKHTASLKLHQLSHQPPPFNRPHACPYCPRRFTQKINLKTHIKMHLRFTGKVAAWMKSVKD